MDQEDGAVGRESLALDVLWLALQSLWWTFMTFLARLFTTRDEIEYINPFMLLN